ncbi:hypothetical protein CYR55_22910 [Chimaeribacter californicus]|uniref:Uncharacterized protein n=1 Tax=Chimaeribacter californicus TaxID=2060067 RepID=A0A2N5DSX7_9GAMM|nr:hypothetical protein [Chimaeribacter californicus]PLR29227.1 hypothetical protein CYR55_22910 [Chimaeribacter californicus]
MMNKQEIKAIFLAHGFQERLQADGSMDLNPYVYEAAEALLERFWIDTSIRYHLFALNRAVTLLRALARFTTAGSTTSRFLFSC